MNRNSIKFLAILTLAMCVESLSMVNQLWVKIPQQLSLEDLEEIERDLNEVNAGRDLVDYWAFLGLMKAAGKVSDAGIEEYRSLLKSQDKEFPDGRPNASSRDSVKQDLAKERLNLDEIKKCWGNITILEEKGVKVEYLRNQLIDKIRCGAYYLPSETTTHANSRKPSTQKSVPTGSPASGSQAQTPHDDRASDANDEAQPGGNDKSGPEVNNSSDKTRNSGRNTADEDAPSESGDEDELEQEGDSAHESLPDFDNDGWIRSGEVSPLVRMIAVLKDHILKKSKYYAANNADFVKDYIIDLLRHRAARRPASHTTGQQEAESDFHSHATKNHEETAAPGQNQTMNHNDSKQENKFDPQGEIERLRAELKKSNDARKREVTERGELIKLNKQLTQQFQALENEYTTLKRENEQMKEAARTSGQPTTTKVAVQGDQSIDTAAAEIQALRQALEVAQRERDEFLQARDAAMEQAGQERVNAVPLRAQIADLQRQVAELTEQLQDQQDPAQDQHDEPEQSIDAHQDVAQETGASSEKDPEIEEQNQQQQVGATPPVARTDEQPIATTSQQQEAPVPIPGEIGLFQLISLNLLTNMEQNKLTEAQIEDILLGLERGEIHEQLKPLLQAIPQDQIPPKVKLLLQQMIEGHVPEQLVALIHANQEVQDQEEDDDAS